LHAADIPVQISCPIMKANKKGYDEVIKYAQSLRIQSITDYIMMAQADLDTSNLANRLSIDETEVLLRDIMKFDDDYKEMLDELNPVSSIPEEEYRKMPLCGAGINDLSVTVNGDIYPCAGWQDFVAGNVFKQPLRDIWENSPKLKQIRAVTPILSIPPPISRKVKSLPWMMNRRSSIMNWFPLLLILNSLN